MLHVGIIGYGAIGRDVARYIAEGKAGRAVLAGVLVRPGRRAATGLDPALVDEDVAAFLARPLDVVVEAAGHDAVRRYATEVLASGRDLIVVSVGALADPALLDAVVRAAETVGRRLVVPSAALAGLDRIAAGATGPLEAVTLTTRKPPRAWVGTPVEAHVPLAELSKPVCVFDGSARDAALRFPESVNVAAALSLAGAGFDRTRVRVYVDPTVTENVHELTAVGAFGRLDVTIRNTPSANPKTGVAVAMSVAKVLRNLSEPLVVGI
ncbi:MAG TPA: aspartate dehydrogenase [Calditerricola sp.]